VVEPFLALFFVFYVAIAILHAWRGRPEATVPVDGLLVFGVPLVGFALQFLLVATPLRCRLERRGDRRRLCRRVGRAAQARGACAGLLAQASWRWP